MRRRGIWSPCWPLCPRESHCFYQEKWYKGAIPRKVALSTLALLPPSTLGQFTGHRPQVPALPCFCVHATLLNDSTMTSWCHCHLTVFCSECYGEPVARMPQSLGDWKQWLLILHERIVLLKRLLTIKLMKMDAPQSDGEAMEIDSLPEDEPLEFARL